MYFFISYTSNALMHGQSWASIFTDSIQNEPVHQNTVTLGQLGELLAPGYGLQAKAESTNCFTIYSKCFRVPKYAYLYRYAYKIPVFIFLFLSM